MELQAIEKEKEIIAAKKLTKKSSNKSGKKSRGSSEERYKQS